MTIRQQHRMLENAIASLPPFILPPSMLARARQSAADIRAVEAAAGLPMLTVESRYQSALAAIDALEGGHV